MSGAGAPGEREVDARGVSLAIVATRWHEDITAALLASALRTAARCGVEEPTVVRVSGAVELPVVAQALIDGGVCREQGILQASGVTAIKDVSAEAAAKFCRDKRKVEAATCISTVLDVDSAQRIGSVARLVRRLDELSQQ